VQHSAANLAAHQFTMVADFVPMQVEEAAKLLQSAPYKH
jgi:hypothetical protein